MSISLTIVIPTYNRHPFLKRVLDFYQKSHFEHDILIADSSDCEQSQKNCSVLSNFQINGGRIRYFHTRDYFSSNHAFSVHEKILKALSLVTTPYAALCADDDFLTPSSLKKFANFLDTHNDYICAKGRIYEIVVSKHGTRSLLPAAQYSSIHSDHVTERVWLASRYYQQSVYGLFRTEALYKILASVPKSLIQQPGWLDELLFSTFAAVMGKIMRIDCPSEYHEIHDSNFGHVVSKWPAITFEDSSRQLAVDYKEALTNFLLRHHPELERAAACKAAESSLIAFSKWYYDTRYRDSHNRPCGSGTLERRDFLQRVMDKLNALRLRIKNEIHRQRAMRFPETRQVMAAVARYQAWQQSADHPSHTS